MKIRFVFLTVIFYSFSLSGQQDQLYTKEKKLAENFIAAHFGKGKIPPFSFMYDGKYSSEFIARWNYSEETKKTDNNVTEHIYKYDDPQTKLSVCCTLKVFNDFPVAEWVVKFKNNSNDSTPVITEIKTSDIQFIWKNKKSYVLHAAKGSNMNISDFAPKEMTLNHNTDVTFGPSQGRSSDTEFMPFFNIDADDEGVIAAIGWSGRWTANVKRDSSDVISLSAGLKNAHFKMLPGEELRIPSIALLFWQGNNKMTGYNIFRKFILAHHTPQKDGKPLTLPFAEGLGYGGPSPCNEYSCATESYVIGCIERLEQFGLNTEVGWIDAGWYDGSEQTWWCGAGNWTINKKNFPNGFKPISDALKKHGMGFIVWFEPERVYQGTKIDKEHPEWLLKLKNNSSSLFNLGNPEARKWLTDYISDMIDKEGITMYRQDFNFDPLPYWTANDTPDRQGISEIKHVEGLYAYWDELLARHPGLLIDNCASGGRRIDLETISRSAALWRSDYSSDAKGSQCQTYGLNFYVPCSGTGNINYTPYYFRSTMSSALVISWDVNKGDFSTAQAQASIEEYKRLRPYFYGDYYPLTEYSTGADAWMAYQFNREDYKDGIILAFRREQSAVPSINVKLQGLLPDKQYEVYFEDYEIKITETGKKLAEEGIDIKISQAPGSLLISYKQSY